MTVQNEQQEPLLQNAKASKDYHRSTVDDGLSARALALSG
jgi:hypothetical protein